MNIKEEIDKIRKEREENRRLAEEYEVEESSIKLAKEFYTYESVGGRTSKIFKLEKKLKSALSIISRLSNEKELLESKIKIASEYLKDDSLY